MARHLHIDPFNGIAGDMLLAALVDAGAPPEALEAVLNGISFPGVEHAAVSFPEVSSHGVLGRQLALALTPAPPEGSRTYPELLALLDAAPLAAAVRARALTALGLLGRAKAAASGVTLEEVRFRELGGFDTLADLLGCAVALDLLGIDTVTCDPLPLTRGSIAVEGATLPCPAPSTLELLKGLPIRGLDLEGELVTPTGVALVLSFASSFSPPPALRVETVGAGFGKREYPGRANCLRVLVGTTEAGDFTRETLLLLEANLDDLSSEILATLPEACLEAGALDAWLAPVLMKKGRPGHVLQALCAEPGAAGVEEAIFRHSSTLGVRRLRVERDALPRSWEEAQTPWGRVRVKVGLLGGEVVNRAPEFEDCRRVAQRAGVPLKDVYAAALRG